MSVGPKGIHRGDNWLAEETEAMMTIWAQQDIQQEMKTKLRNHHVFQEIAYRLANLLGAVRTPDQCRSKFKKLKREYLAAKRENSTREKTGAPVRRCAFYDIFDRALDPGCYGNMSPSTAVKREVGKEAVEDFRSEANLNETFQIGPHVGEDANEAVGGDDDDDDDHFGEIDDEEDNGQQGTHIGTVTQVHSPHGKRW